MTRAGFIFLVVLAGASSSVAARGVSLPSTWTLVSQDDDRRVFKNTASRSNERLVVQSFPAEPKDASVMDHMSLRELTQSRRRFMADMGLTDYTALNFRDAAKTAERKTLVIESTYRDFHGHDVQMVERQSLENGKMAVITYLNDVHAIDDMNAVDQLIERAVPVKAAKRKSAALFSRDFLEALLGPSAFATTNAEDGSILAAQTAPSDPVGPPAEEKPMSAADIAKKCEKIPAEKRRSPNDNTFLSQVKSTLATPKNCFMGVVDNVWDMVKGAYHLAVGGVKYVFNSEYRSQVNATVGVVASEAYKDPKGFAMKVATSVYDAAKKSVGEFFECLNTGAQIRAVCNIATNFVPAGLLVKVVTKVPLAAGEAVKAAQIMKRVVFGGDGARGVEKAVTETAEAAGQAAKVEKAVQDTAQVATETAVQAPVAAAAKAEGVVNAEGAISKAAQEPVATVAEPARIPPEPARVPAAAAPLSAERAQAIEKSYGDLLSAKARDAETLQTISNLEERGVPREKIRDTLREAEEMCLTH